MEDNVDLREQIFHKAVREYIIWLLLFVLLYVSSYVAVCAWKRRPDKEDYYSGDTEDAIVYRISVWLCTFSLAVSAGAVLLLPISIAANEALLVFPNSYYFQWVNSSLIHGLWNQIFLCSNLSLFVFMPFAYLLTESEGLPGSRRGLMSRMLETALVLALVSVLICGLAWVASAIIDNDSSSRKALFDIWDFYLPYLYSCISLLGVVMLLICTPVGFARLFSVIGELVIKPKFLRDLDEELSTIQFEEDALQIKLNNTATHHRTIANGHSRTDLQEQLNETQREKAEILKRRSVSSLRRNLGYPLVMLLLLALTSSMVLMVALNMLELLIGLKALPKGTKEIVLGLSSLSALGPIGAAIEIIIILYLMLASVVGFYSLPLLRKVQPKLHDTSMPTVIANCMILVVLTSALPVLSRTLGITNFDLLGNFGRMEWLGNFYIILSYNFAFAIATAICLATKFTAALRRELIHRLGQAFVRHRRNTIVTASASSSSTSFVGNNSHPHSE